jgi:hypothetical protein
MIILSQFFTLRIIKLIFCLCQAYIISWSCDLYSGIVIYSFFIFMRILFQSSFYKSPLHNSDDFSNLFYFLF